jgi:hypothetical protein
LVAVSPQNDMVRDIPLPMTVRHVIDLRHLSEPQYVLMTVLEDYTKPSAWLLELGKGPTGSLQVSIPIDSMQGDVSAFTSAIGAGVAGAAVYPALKNPVNGRVIGPDRSRTKAWIRFYSSREGRIVGRVVELFVPIGPGDVMADFSSAGAQLGVDWIVLTGAHVPPE